MTNTLDELERAVKALTDMRDAARDGTPVTDPNEWEFDELTRILAVFHFLLSDRDELLATVERMRGQLEIASEALLRLSVGTERTFNASTAKQMAASTTAIASDAMNRILAPAASPQGEGS